MKWKSVGAICLAGMLLLSGCDKKDDNKPSEATETKAINDDDYAALLPFQVSDARQKHHTAFNSNLTNTFDVGEGLMKLSKEYFSPQTYAYRENQFLGYNTLDAINDGTGLLGRESESNPNGLNLKAKKTFPSDHGDVLEPIIVLTIFEIDWYKEENLSGISLALVIRSKIEDESKNITYQLDNDKLKLFAEERAIKTVKYLRKTHPEIGDNMPIYVTIYESNGSDELPGTFKEAAYFKSNTDASFTTLKNEWGMFPTVNGNKLDSTTQTYFLNYKNKLNDLDLGDDISIIGNGKFWDEKLDKLQISVKAHAKTGLEMNAIVQTLNANLSIFASTGYRITVDISCDDVHVAMIERPKGTTKTNTIFLWN